MQSLVIRTHLVTSYVHTEIKCQFNFEILMLQPLSQKGYESTVMAEYIEII
jgi:hypothetical protein